MSNKFQDKYRISSSRLQNWDDGWNAIYFVTVNTQGQEHFFGEIRNERIQLSNIGTIADVLWYEIKNHFNVVALDAFVVMPNYVHGVLAINNLEKKQSIKDIGNALSVQLSNKEDKNISGDITVETRHALFYGDQKKTPGKDRFKNQGKNSLSSILGSYKSAVSKNARHLGYRFDWQSRFHDRIIRDEESLLKARKYIENNIVKWENDEFNLGVK